MAIRGGKGREKVTVGVITLMLMMIALPFMLIGKLLSWLFSRK